jgi:hypothetical protein
MSNVMLMKFYMEELLLTAQHNGSGKENCNTITG